MQGHMSTAGRVEHEHSSQAVSISVVYTKRRVVWCCPDGRRHPIGYHNTSTCEEDQQTVFKVFEISKATARAFRAHIVFPMSLSALPCCKQPMFHRLRKNFFFHLSRESQMEMWHNSRIQVFSNVL